MSWEGEAAEVGSGSGQELGLLGSRRWDGRQGSRRSAGEPPQKGPAVIYVRARVNSLVLECQVATSCLETLFG